jgi:iron(II)-dependent oxidoreductase
MTAAPSTATSKEAIAGALEDARARSLGLLEPLPDADLLRQHSPLMSPLAWDLAHVGNYEDLWLLGSLTGERSRADLDDVYDAFRHPRADRPALPMLGPEDARSYIAGVRGRALDILDALDLDSGDQAAGTGLLAGGFVYGMVVQHEHQHDETMLATLQLRAAPYPAPRPASAPAAPGATKGVSAEVLVPAGSFVMGTDPGTEPWAYDNERPAHVVDLPAFWIDTTPVTSGAYLEFMADGGYGRPRLWTPEGWAWRTSAGLVAPQFWARTDGDGWTRVRFGRREPLPLDEPVQHVCWYEADAYARWAGRRLPTEAEWEKAASWTAAGTKRRYPWGDDPPLPARANLWHPGTPFSPAGAASVPAGASPWGAHQLIGDVWEWTASDFAAYPGFRSFPYREYSEVFFGSDYKVLRGGSWATHPAAVRTTFRNWDYPIRRQIFSGFRCARDA